jgi:hypothetical protein
VGPVHKRVPDAPGHKCHRQWSPELPEYHRPRPLGDQRNGPMRTGSLRSRTHTRQPLDSRPIGALGGAGVIVGVSYCYLIPCVTVSVWDQGCPGPVNVGCRGCPPLGEKNLTAPHKATNARTVPSSSRWMVFMQTNVTSAPPNISHTWSSVHGFPSPHCMPRAPSGKHLPDDVVTRKDSRRTQNVEVHMSRILVCGESTVRQSACDVQGVT